MQAGTPPMDASRPPDAAAPRLALATPWGPWTALLLAVLITVLGIMGSLVLAKLGLLALPSVATGDSIGLQVLLVQQLIVIALTLLVGLRAPGPVATFALARPTAGLRAYAAGIGLIAAFQVVATSLEFLFVPQDMVRDLKPFLELARGPLWLFGLVVIGLGAPLSEELLFRGLLLPALAKSRLGFPAAAVVTSALWTSLHASYSLTGLLEVFIAGLLFAWLLWRTGSLRVTMVCHGLYNALIVLGLRYLPLPALFTG
jgi:uncharacterized protein